MKRHIYHKYTKLVRSRYNDQMQVTSLYNNCDHCGRLHPLTPVFFRLGFLR